LQLTGNDNNFELEFERIEDASVLLNFFCGINEMDDFIHSKLQSYINDSDCKTYVVKSNGTIVAMFSLCPDMLSLDEDDEYDMKIGAAPKPRIAFTDKQFFTNREFDAIELAYLAVSKDYKKRGIGEFVISEIENKIRIEDKSCQFLTVEAYKTPTYSAIGFYEKCHFTPSELPIPTRNTLKMYKVLFPLKHFKD
jgi:GNAT superfamily N-acetyltransferase